jgi:alpha-beta hydrolase superfamily lysophospholipase
MRTSGEVDALFVLVHSPLVGPATWAPVAGELAARGLAVTVPELRDVGETGGPYWQQHAASCATALVDVSPGLPLVLVGHSGAGLLLPAIARACGRPVTACVYVDSDLPLGDVSRLARMEQEAPDFAAELRAHLAAGHRFPEWTDADLRETIPDQRLRRAVLADLRPRFLAFFEEPIPGFAGDPDAPCGYLQFSEVYAAPAARAHALGWPCVTVRGGHFHMLVDPAGVADATIRLAG